MIHKRKLRDVQSAVRSHQGRPYAPTITMRNAKKDAMLESKLFHDLIAYPSFFLFLIQCFNRALYWNREGKPYFARENVQYHAEPEAQTLQPHACWEGKSE